MIEMDSLTVLEARNQFRWTEIKVLAGLVTIPPTPGGSWHPWACGSITPSLPLGSHHLLLLALEISPCWTTLIKTLVTIFSPQPQDEG